MAPSNKTAIVTGGLSGMGLAIARRLANDGVDVTIGARRGGDTKTVDSILKEKNVTARVGALDVQSNVSVDAFVKEVVTRRGGVDILINAAGVYDEAGWGRIINLASVAAHNGMANNAAYCASKAGLLGLGRCVSLEGAEHGVTCVSISPTWVETEMLRQFIDSDIETTGKSLKEVREDYAKSNPQNQLVQPEEIADLAAFLVSDAGRAMTMEDIQVNAGSLW